MQSDYTCNPLTHLPTLHSFHTARRAILFGTIATLLAASAQADFNLTLLHNNDGESKLPSSFSGGVNFGGAAFLAGLIQSERAAALALSEIGYDAIAFGNHDFDFGPGTLVGVHRRYHQRQVRRVQPELHW